MKPVFLIFFMCFALFAWGDALRPVMIYDTEVILDRSWNEAIHNGIERFEKYAGVDVLEKSIVDLQFFEKMTKHYASSGYNPIILNYINDEKAAILSKVMKASPHTKFVILNGELENTNAHYFVFSYQEATYLAGFLAARKSRAKRLSFIGGMDIPVIRSFLCGYIAGAKRADSEVQVDYDFIGGDHNAWSSPYRAFGIASRQISDGADVVFAAAGGSSAGALKAASKYNVLGIGVDTNQNGLYPGQVLTSVLVRVDNAVFSALRATMQKSWKKSKRVMGLKDDGVGLAFDEYNAPLVSAADRADVEKLTRGIVYGNIQVPDYVRDGKCVVNGEKVF